MRTRSTSPFVLAALLGTALTLHAQSGPTTPPRPPDPGVQALVSRLDLERYKATIKGLTPFGDRREGTDRNRAAVDWIEAQLKSYGCTNTERITYDFQPRPPAPRAPVHPNRSPPASSVRRRSRPRAADGPRGIRVGTGVNTDPMKQPDEKLRALNTQPSTPGTRQEVYCTKIGTSRPDEMYIVAAHMDGHGWGEAANDDGSGTALVMELARVFSSPDVRTDRSIRFALWNNEETGLNGSARLRRSNARIFRGKKIRRDPAAIPNRRWLGMIQHDMMLFDHGAPRADGTMSKRQRPEADVNVEFQLNSKLAAESQALGWVLERANEKYATDYPASSWQPHDQHRFVVVHGCRAVDQRARESARHRDRQRLGSAVAPAH